MLVDDVELLAGTTLEGVLDALARRGGPGALVLAGSTAALLGSYRGPVATARAARTGVLLRPEAPADGEVLGVRAVPPDRSQPGRGVLVLAGEQQPVQVAH